MSDQPQTKGPRWWPAVTIIILANLALFVVWSVEAPQRQRRVIHTVTVVGWTGMLLSVWLLLFSRMRWRQRLTTFALLAAAGGATYGSLDITGVTGDLVPLIGWRWQTTEAAPRLISQATSGPAWDSEKSATVVVRPSPQFRGPQRDGVIRGVDLDPDWTDRPPHELWRRTVGAAWSAFAISGEHAVTQEQRGPEEVVVCYALLTGRQRWLHADPVRYATRLGGIGPRATPTVFGNRVYALGATGLLTCLALDSGERIWQRNLLEASKAKLVQWGASCSPLIVDELVVASPGGLSGPSLVALDRQTGEPVWQAGTDQSGYSSPRLVTLAGKRQLMMFNRGWISGYDVRTGNQLWRQQWKGGGECVAMPIPLPPNRFLVSTGYGVGTRLFELDNQLNPRQIWRSRRMRAKFTNLIHRDGLIYGLSDGVLSCIELTEGKRAWRGKRYGHGQVLCVGDLLLIQADNGRVVLVRVSPQDYTELGSIQALSGKTWNPPTLAPPFLLVRNDRQAVCYRLPLK